MNTQSRRLFLSQTALAALGLMLLPHCKKSNNPDDNPSEENKQNIIVVGAGIAGLAAAKLLKNAGHQVKVLEASSRYGGRIQSIDMDGYKADFGASWIHGIIDNPLYSLANSNNIITKQTHYDPSYIFDIDGEEITNEDWIVIENLFVRLYDLALDNIDSSIQELLDIMQPDLNLSEKLTRLWYGAVRSEYEIPYAVDATDISAQSIIATDSFPGEDVIFPDGMQSLCDVLANDLDIEYNAFVSKVTYDTEQVQILVNKADEINVKRSCMACHSGTNAETLTSNDVRTADKVIIALPLGILKNGGICFEPELSIKKKNAIDSLGIGTMNKVFLKFNENFWYEDAYFLEQLHEDSSHIIEFFSPAPTGTPNVLVGVFSGQHARSIEHMDNEQLKEMVMNELKAMFGENIPEPVAMEKTSWHTHPFALGSYPHLKPGSNLSACEIIAKPLNSKVFFAGDATSKNYMATAHGAYLSGLKAANNAIS